MSGVAGVTGESCTGILGETSVESEESSLIEGSKGPVNNRYN